MQPAPLLSVENVSIQFKINNGFLKKHTPFIAAQNVNFNIYEGETLGLIGESGSGKSTLARAIMGITPITSGKIQFKNTTLPLKKSPPKSWYRQIQMIFQDSAESLNPRHTIGYTLQEPFIIHHMGTPAERMQWVHILLDQVGLPKSAMKKYAFEFSGGQRQRINIARAIALKPALIICDEPTSALDVSIQAQILNLLNNLKKTLKISYLFISHDLHVIHHMADRITVMKDGECLETQHNPNLFHHPTHPYTADLIKNTALLNT